MLKIYGASDDLIELDGDLYEEFSRYNSEGDYLAFSDGTVLKIVYDHDGLWRISIVYKGTLFDHKDDGNVEEDENDVVYLRDGIKWCVIGEEIAKAR